MKKLFTKFKINKGFTLIETLVAITILMISIVGPLTIAQKSLMAAISAKDQITASYLAQELMEGLKNQRDNARLAGTSFSAWVGNQAFQTNVECNGACTLYQDLDGIYTTDPADINRPSKFSRWVYASYNNNVNNGHEVRISVVVSWNEGSYTNYVKVDDNFFDITL